MPIYTFECDTCGFQSEELMSIHTPSDTTLQCPVGHSIRTFAKAPDVLLEPCPGTLRRVPSSPAPAQFNCSMPTYQRPKKGNT